MCAQSILFSRTTGFAFSLVSAGTLAWYTHLFGFPLLPEAKAMTMAEHGLHPPAYPWAHKGMMQGFDHASCVSPVDRKASVLRWML